MDPQRHRIQEDLRGLVAGTVLCDDVTLQQYSSDASIFQMRPLGVVRPSHHEDVVAVMKYADQNSIPVTARGAGSGLAGEAIGHGLVIDFSHSMCGITSVGRDTVTVQPGVVLANLNRHLAKYGRIFGPDPATRSFSTIGSSIARDAAGSHWLDFGSTGDKVVHLRLVLADGTSIEVGTTATDRNTEHRQSKFLMQSSVASCLQRYQALIQRESRESQAAGYRFQGIDLQCEIDLLPLIIGSEGTLALITEATLATDPWVSHRGVVLLFFSKITDAAKVSCQLAKQDITACDLLDRRLLSIARESDARYADMIPVAAEAMLLVEAKDNDLNTLMEKLKNVVSSAQDQLAQNLPNFITTDDEKRDLCWRLVRRIIPTLYRLRGSTRAIPYVEDILVPPRNLEQFLIMAQDLFNQHQITTSVFAHAAQSRIHLRPFIDITNRKQMELLVRLTEQLYSNVWHLGGTVGAHGGLGLARTPYLRSQAGSLYPILSEIKRIFDPKYILNPGKIIQNRTGTHLDFVRSVVPQAVSFLDATQASDSQVMVKLDQINGLDVSFQNDENDPDNLKQASLQASFDSPIGSRDDGEGSEVEKRKIAIHSGTVAPNSPHLRTASPTRALNVLQPELQWDSGSLMQATRNCNGCGRCRTEGSIERMCPMFRADNSEEASPRAKANLLRAVMTGELEPNVLTSEEIKAVTDTCFNCHQCRVDCPASVDIPKIVNEMRAHYWATNGLSLSERLLNRLDLLFRVASLSPTLTNFLVTQNWSRWILAKVFGIAANRKLPKFHGRTFLSWARRRRLDKAADQSNRKVVLFVDAFVNWNDSELGRALVCILEHNGIAVSVPQNQKISGLSLISAGAVGPARKIAQANVSILAELVREGAQVVTSEPAAALAIKHEYQHILSDPDAKLVADNTFEATEFLWKLHQEGKLNTDFRPTPITIAHHLPCHQRATVEGNPGIDLLRLIPELEVVSVEKGCSGMAGMFGVFEKNYWRSLKIGHELIREIRKPIFLAGTTECSSCRIQMEQGASKPTVHPIKILARAYGLMPELEDVFERKCFPRVLS